MASCVPFAMLALFRAPVVTGSVLNGTTQLEENTQVNIKEFVISHVSLSIPP